MTQIIIDEQLAQRLRDEQSEVQLCAPDGTVLGMFRPETLQKLYREANCPISSEELKRRNSEGGGRTLDEIVADLERNG